MSAIKYIQFNNGNNATENFTSEVTPRYLKGRNVKSNDTKKMNFFVFGKNSKQTMKQDKKYVIKNRYEDIYNGNNENPAVINDYEGLKIDYSPKNILISLPKSNESKSPRPLSASRLKTNIKSSTPKLKKIKDRSKVSTDYILTSNHQKIKIAQQNLFATTFQADKDKPQRSMSVNLKKSDDALLKSRKIKSNFKITSSDAKTKQRSQAKKSPHFKEEMISGDNKQDIQEDRDMCIEDEFEINPENNSLAKEGLNGGSSEEMIKTIKLISENPRKYKYTNQILRELGQLSAGHLGILSKELIKDNLDKQMQVEKKKTKMMKVSPKQSNEDDDSRYSHIIESIKAEIKKKRSFDINKLDEKDRDMLLAGMKKRKEKEKEKEKRQLEAQEREKEELNNKILMNPSENNQKEYDNLLMNSNELKDKNQSARRLIEGVIEKIESNNQKLIALSEKRGMNGFLLKAYPNLHKKEREPGKCITQNEKKFEVAEKKQEKILYNPAAKRNIKKSYHPFLVDE